MSRQSGEVREARYKSGAIPYCQWCVETGDWENHKEHGLVEEHYHEQEICHHVEMIAFNGVCSRCHLTEDLPNKGCRTI